MSTVALVIIYNHQYNKNIDVLEKIYRNRFTNIYHLVPFYRGGKSNVIAVYENSYYFQGYIAQGLAKFFEKYYKHFFFIGDDLLLNPEINENNYTVHFDLDDDACFIPELISLHETTAKASPWPRVAEAFYYQRDANGVEAKAHLPSFDEAMKAFGKFNLDLKPLTYRQIWGSPGSRTGLKTWLRFLKNMVSPRPHRLPYPLVGGYSDICIVSAGTIELFCHYCGITAATNLFVEVGLPSALVLSAKKIVTELELEWKGLPLWVAEDYLILEKYEFSLSSILADFPAGILYVHPIKLSKWVLNEELEIIPNNDVRQFDL